MIKEGGAEAVKIEGGNNIAAVIRAVVSIDIPVMAHIGLTPQSVHRMGGYKVQGRNDQAKRIKDDAHAVQDASAFAVVLEGIPASLAFLSAACIKWRIICYHFDVRTTR